MIFGQNYNVLLGREVLAHFVSARNVISVAVRVRECTCEAEDLKLYILVEMHLHSLK